MEATLILVLHFDKIFSLIMLPILHYALCCQAAFILRGLFEALNGRGVAEMKLS